jgi:hypothetical protein
MSSMDWLDSTFPDSTSPAYRIQGASLRAGRACRIARRTHSVNDTRTGLATRFTCLLHANHVITKRSDGMFRPWQTASRSG